MWRGFKIHRTLAFRLFISLIVILIIVFSINTFYSINRQESQIMHLVEISAIRNSDIIKRSTRYGMLVNRREDVHQIIQTVGDEPGVEGIRIYNKRGEIIFSTKEEEIFKKEDLNSVSCNPCHAVSYPRANLTDKERIRIFHKENGDRILGLINPIRNEEECSNVACHVHPPNVEILGVLDVQMSLESIDKQIAENRNNLILSSIIITLLIAFFSGIFIWIMVYARVKELIDGTKAISSGNLDYTLDIKANDELGELANDFNVMSKNLSKAYTEIKEWNENLNQKVSEKTNQLKEIYEHVVQIEKIASLGKLSATVAHELSNPLEGILTYSKLIMRKLNNSDKYPEKEKILSYLQLIAAESDRCGNIVKNLLLFSRTSEKEISKNDIVSLIERSLMLVAHHLEINNVKLTKNYDAEYFEIDCDKNQIQQSLVAILINAVEAMPNGGELTVQFKIEHPNIKLVISDTGIGIPEENLNQIYEPFFTTKTSGKGTGLGLSIVYGIVQQHNGKISVESKINEGTKISIVFPIKYVKETVKS